MGFLKMDFHYIRPANEDAFEEFCVRFYRQLLKRGGMYRYAKRGETQDGIDVIDQQHNRPLYAIQCKCHEPNKTIPPQEIKDEVAAAELSSHDIDVYIIATTAKKSRNAHDTVLELNKDFGTKRIFQVEIHFWEDICAHLTEFGPVIAACILFGVGPHDELIAPLGSASSNTHSATDDKDGELFPNIEVLFKERKIEAAAHEIYKLPDAEQVGDLSQARRYAILRLRAKLALEKQDLDEAVRLFDLAYKTNPTLPQARQNRVLSLELQRKPTEAFAEAAKLIDEGIRSPFLVSLLIRNSRSADDLHAFKELIDELALDNLDVNVALAMKCIEEGQVELGEEAAQNARRLDAESAHAHLSCGQVAHLRGLEPDCARRKDFFEEAILCYSAAVTASERDAYVGLTPEIYTLRGRVYSLLGYIAKAGNDFRHAVTASGSRSLHVESAISFFLHFDDYDAARELAPLLDKSSAKARFLATAVELPQLREWEKKERIRALAADIDQDTACAVEARFHCVQWALESRDLELAREFVPKQFVDRFPFQGNILLGWIAFKGEDADLAQQQAKLALASTPGESHRAEELAVLARLLVELGDEASALPLLERAAAPGVLSADCKLLVDCAQGLERHDILLRVCSELRQTGQQDDVIRKLEIDLLTRYSPVEAFALASEFEQFDKPYFAANRNYIACRLGKFDQLVFHEDALLSPDAIAPERAALVIDPYLKAGRYQQAIEFAYHQLRNYFDVELAHQHYAFLMLNYGDKAEIPPFNFVVDTEMGRVEKFKQKFGGSYGKKKEAKKK